MKKILLSTAILAVSLASCTKTDVVENPTTNDSNKIGFSTYTNHTKGNPYESNAEFLTPGSTFGVAGFISTDESKPYLGSLVSGAKMVYGTDWEHDIAEDMRYWPTKGETIDFFAYSPYIDANATITPTFDKTNGVGFTNYKVAANEASQVDLMYASAFDETRSKLQTDDVILQFKHALVQVHFAAKTVSSGMYVEIEENGVQINNIKTIGDFAMSLTDEGKASWSGQETLGSYQFTSNVATIDDDATLDAITIQDKALMLLPQEFDAWDLSGKVTEQTGAYIAINCKIYYADSKNAAEVDRDYRVGENGKYETIYLPISSKATCAGGTMENIWEMGKKITFNLNFGGGYDEEGNPILNPITFDATVVDWDTETPTL